MPLPDRAEVSTEGNIGWQPTTAGDVPEDVRLRAGRWPSAASWDEQNCGWADTTMVGKASVLLLLDRPMPLSHQARWAAIREEVGIVGTNVVAAVAVMVSLAQLHAG